MNIEPDPVYKSNVESKKDSEMAAEQSMETDDSLEDLCNDVMPSPTKDVSVFITQPLLNLHRV